MRTNLGRKSYFWPLPVTVIGSYDENGLPDAMTAVYATLHDYNQIFVSLDLSHKTADNIKITKAFTLSFATQQTMIQADFVGLVSKKIDAYKIEESHLNYEKSSFVNAPIFTDFPITIECKLISMVDGDLIGDIVNISVDNKYIKDGKIDTNSINFISFDPTTLDYKLIGNEIIGKSHNIGNKLRKQNSNY